MTTSHSSVASGRPRTLGKKPAELCADCKYVEPNWPNVGMREESA